MIAQSVSTHLLPRILLTLSLVFLTTASVAQQPGVSSIHIPQEGDYLAHDFHFRSGESLPEMRLHYLTFGKPVRDQNGRVTNAVLILHGTGGSGRQFLQRQFADELFGPGQLLDS